MAEGNGMNINRDIRTLEDSLLYFNLSSHLQQLETSLEDVRRNKKSKEDHEECFKQIDKEIQKLSFKYHPDKVKNRGGTGEDEAAAQKLQTAINSTRTALKLLNSAFLEDIGTDHKFGFYTKLNIDLICNEDEMQYQIFEVMLKIGVISRIKQQNIISEIGKFLIKSTNCVRSYLDKANDFEKHRDLAFIHFKCCIKGLKKLYAELEEVRKEFKSEKNHENMVSLMEKMAIESERDLQLLKSLKKSAKEALNGKYNFFSPPEVMDPYFVLPLVSYMNVILMCNVMVRSNATTLNIAKRISTSFTSAKNYFIPELDPCDNVALCYLKDLHYLTSYYSGDKRYEKEVLKIIGRNVESEKDLNVQISKERIKSEFYEGMQQINERLEHDFKVEDYAAILTTNLLMQHLKKCMEMMSQIEQKEKIVSEGIKEFRKETEKLNETCEKLKEIMEATEELNQRVERRLEENKLFREEI